jgi:membrane-bound inhibitor of C-type lysozyme
MMTDIKNTKCYHSGMKIKNAIMCCIVLLLLISITVFVWPKARPSTGHPVASATFSCDGGKTIQATFYSGTSTLSTDPNQPPVLGGSVALVLSDGRNMILPQVISADGGRYANASESIVFWNVGDTAFMTENNAKTYTNCTTPSDNSTTSVQ